MKLKKIISIILLLFVFFILESCSSMHTNVGLDMTFGPNGPRVTPSVGVNMYGGGRW
ncbi:hypothetical protein [Namhaeicola litoreus]|uniref:Lipoprotein n=1 Tax=Namhaeicola litoreus TaxID=1052145 RepID=A0ABW3Y664_9FLAO